MNAENLAQNFKQAMAKSGLIRGSPPGFESGANYGAGYFRH